MDFHELQIYHNIYEKLFAIILCDYQKKHFYQIKKYIKNIFEHKL